MKASLVLMSLYSLCTLSLSQECRRDLLENIDFPGTDITHLYSPDVDHCQQLCTHHPACRFFTFLRHDWTADSRNFYCYIKSTESGEPNRQTPLKGVTSGYSLKSCNSETIGSPEHSDKPCLSRVYVDMDFLGVGYQSLFTHDYKECQRACTSDPGCHFFTFVNEVFPAEQIRYTCHLKYSWTIPRLLIIERTAGTISGFSHKAKMSKTFNTVCQGQLFENMDIPGNNIERLPAASPHHCQALCSAHPTCTYFSYASASFTCQFKKNPNEMVFAAKVGVTSGLPARFCQLDNNWLKESQTGVDFRGSDIQFELMDDAESCQRTCTNNPHCQFYTYVNEEFSNSVYWRRCFHKRVITLPAPLVVHKVDNVISGFSMKNSDVIYYNWKVPEGERHDSAVKRNREGLAAELKLREGYLQKVSGSYLTGKSFTLADVTVYPSVAHVFRFGLSESRYPKLAAYYKNLKERPSIKATWPPTWLENPQGQDMLKDI